MATIEYNYIESLEPFPTYDDTSSKVYIYVYRDIEKKTREREDGEEEVYYSAQVAKIKKNEATTALLEATRNTQSQQDNLLLELDVRLMDLEDSINEQ